MSSCSHSITMQTEFRDETEMEMIKREEEGVGGGWFLVGLRVRRWIV